MTDGMRANHLTRLSNKRASRLLIGVKLLEPPFLDPLFDQVMKRVFQRPRLSLFMLAAFLCSCVSNVNLQRITPATHVSNGRAIIVTDAFIHGRFDFPGGKYTAVWRDEEGVYYQAPEKVIAHFLVPAGASPVDGGIYVSAGQPALLRAYIAESSYPPYKPPPRDRLQINYHFVD